MSDRTIRYSFFEITWVIIGFLLIAVYFLLKEIREIPPYIVLSESESAFRFDSGSYELTPAFRAALDEIVIPQISELAKAYKCDVVQVIGHTDGIGMKSKYSSLDYTIMPFLNGGEVESAPLPGSNVDLGMLRAIVVADYLIARIGEMPGVKEILPYSAGPIIDPRGSLRTEDTAFEDERSRRVELRLTVAGEQKVSAAEIVTANAATPETAVKPALADSTVSPDTFRVELPDTLPENDVIQTQGSALNE